MVTDAQTADPDSIGLLIVANEAVNEEVIDIEEKYPQKTKSSSEEDPIKEKHSGNDSSAKQTNGSITSDPSLVRTAKEVVLEMVSFKIFRLISEEATSNHLF